jgi:hypothetical protein
MCTRSKAFLFQSIHAADFFRAKLHFRKTFVFEGGVKIPTLVIPSSWSCVSPVAEFFIIGERFVVVTRQLQAAEVLSNLYTMNAKLSFV